MVTKVTGLPGASVNRDFAIRRASWLSLKLQNLGLHGDRLMWWCNTEPANFGDWIGPLIFRHQRGSWPVLAPVYMRPNRAPVHLAAGSILDAVSVPDVAVIWGTGIMSRDVCFAAPREIRAVRGPLTAVRCRELGHACPDVFGDPGIVLPRYLPMRADSDVRLGVIPHFVDQPAARALFGDREDLLLLDVTRSVEEVVADIQRCAALVSSSLHGVIVAHAFGRPCAWVEFGDSLAGDGTKFADYFLSAGLDAPPDPARIGAGTTPEELERLARAAPLPDLSRQADRLLDACPF